MSKQKEHLIKMVESSGLYLQSNAKEIVGELPLINDFSIKINFCDYDGSFYLVPKISINSVHFVNKKKLVDNNEILIVEGFDSKTSIIEA